MADYAVIRDSDGLIVNVIEWDGAAAWSPPAGTTAVVIAAAEAVIDGWYAASTFHAPSPAIDSIDPATDVAAGGATVTIQGYNLGGPDVVVKFDGVSATNIVNQTKTSLQCDVPAHATGTVDVTVENDAGSWTGRGTLTSGFEFTA